MRRLDPVHRGILTVVLGLGTAALFATWVCYLNYACRQTCALEGFNQGESFGPSQCVCWQAPTKAHVPRR